MKKIRWTRPEKKSFNQSPARHRVIILAFRGCARTLCTCWCPTSTNIIILPCARDAPFRTIPQIGLRRHACNYRGRHLRRRYPWVWSNLCITTSQIYLRRRCPAEHRCSNRIRRFSRDGPKSRQQCGGTIGDPGFCSDAAIIKCSGNRYCQRWFHCQRSLRRSTH